LSDLRLGKYLPGVLVFVVLAAFVYVHVRAQIQYSRIETGMTRTEVVERLGSPRRETPELIFCHPNIPWSGDCPESPPGGKFLYFKYGIDRWVVVGIDARSVVWFKTLGDT